VKLPRKEKNQPGATPWDTAVASLNALYDQLDVTTGPADRAELYDRTAAAEEAAARAVDLDVMPPLDPGEGASYAQAYAGAARLCRILAEGERRFGRMPFPGLVAGMAMPGVPRDDYGLWGRYLGSDDRRERAELLTALYDATAASIGTAAASPLNRASLSELAIARPAGR
jgi:hypothetical protein